MMTTKSFLVKAFVDRWVNEVRDPGAEMVLQLGDALQEINPEAAAEFMELYLGPVIDSEK
jgi:hypothetical protein